MLPILLFLSIKVLTIMIIPLVVGILFVALIAGFVFYKKKKEE